MAEDLQNLSMQAKPDLKPDTSEGNNLNEQTGKADTRAAIPTVNRITVPAASTKDKKRVQKAKGKAGKVVAKASLS